MLLRGVPDESAVLLRQLDDRLLVLHSEQHLMANLDKAERLADDLRRLVVGAATEGVAERARVRAAVHYFVGRRDKRQRRPRTVAAELNAVDRMVRDIPKIN